MAVAERDRLLTQAERDAQALAALTHAGEAAEQRAATAEIRATAAEQHAQELADQLAAATTAARSEQPPPA